MASLKSLISTHIKRGMSYTVQTYGHFRSRFAPVLILLLTVACSDNGPKDVDSNNELIWHSLGPFQGPIRTVYDSDETGILVGSTSALSRSLNNGSTWTLDSLNWWRVMTLGSSGRLWAVFENRLHLSNNAGYAWNPILSLGETSWDAVLAMGDSILLVGSTSALTAPLYCSQDLAETWVGITTGFAHPVESYNVRVWSLARTDNGQVFAGTTAGIYRSADTGLTWERSSNGFAEDQDDLSINVLSLGVDSQGILYAGSWIGVGVYRSMDSGNTWQYSGLDHVATVTMVSHPSGALLAGTNAGVYGTFDHGESWIYLGLEDLDVRAIFINGGGTILVGSQNHGGLRRANPNW